MGLLPHSRLAVLPIVSPLRLRAVLMACLTRFTRPTVNVPSADQIKGKGFGHMGMFDAQIVVQSVENVGAVPEFEIPESASKPQ